MSKEHTTEHLRAELKSLSDTLEEVLSSSGEKSKEELSKIRSKAEQALKQSRYRQETGDAIAKQTWCWRRRVPMSMCAKIRGRAWALALQSVKCSAFCCRVVNYGDTRARAR